MPAQVLKLNKMISKYKKILTFFAHPDDETLAAGATINKLSNSGSQVYVAIPATGIHARKNTQKKNVREKKLSSLRNDTFKALSIIGVKKSNIFFGDFDDNELDKHTLLKLIHWIEKLIDKIKPDAIFTHHRYCTNIDHQYCHEACIVATRPSINSHIPVFCGEVPSSTGYLKPTQWEPNFYVNVSKDDVKAKIKAMQTFKDEARPDPHPRSPEVLMSLAKVRGSESGFFFAESFMMQKMFEY
jgi:N-acetylglucosamine malate deacetylase 1